MVRRNTSSATLSAERDAVKTREYLGGIHLWVCIQAPPIINNIRQYMSYKIDRCWGRLPKSGGFLNESLGSQKTIKSAA